MTYRVPKSSAGLVEKLFAAYQVPYVSPEDLKEDAHFDQSIRDRVELAKELSFTNFMAKGSIVWPDSFGVPTSTSPSLDETSGANQILQDRFHK